MQNSTTGNGSTSWMAGADDGVQSRNLAAIALAEAMQRARNQFEGNAGIAAEPEIKALSPKQSLDALRKKLKPLYSAIPQDVEGMDLGVVREDKPRLYLDMVSFVDVAEDQKTYRLVQGGRNGPQVLLETLDDTALITRITDYIAQRLIVRERAFDQADSVVTSAGHFSRGVSAGVAQSQISTEQYLVPPKASFSPAPAFATTAAPPIETPVAAAIIEEKIIEKPAFHAAKETAQTLADQKRATQNFATQALQHNSVDQTSLVHSDLTQAKATAQPAVRTILQSNAQIPSTAALKNALNGWWLWPTLAVLLGMAFAAYLLYLYSMSFNV